MNLLDDVKNSALNGVPCSVDDALRLNDMCGIDELCDAADEVRRKWNGNRIDTCSIVNARSGRCSEDCKWCAQSKFYSTGCDEYDIVPTDEMMRVVRMNTSRGVGRFSLVTSGRKIAPGDIDRFCGLFRKISEESPIYLCASMGLLSKDELMALKKAGVRRYHCNLETSSSYFPSLCSTHTHADKLKTIRAAREIGMDVCCGGIIGMGENMRQRLELAEEAREAGACSIPVNILSPIKGTPLENIPLITEEEIVRTVALFRLIAPKCVIRTAGGRLRLSRESISRMLHGGLNGSIVGDLLTTVGNNVDQDKELFESNGYEW